MGSRKNQEKKKSSNDWVETSDMSRHTKWTFHPLRWHLHRLCTDFTLLSTYDIRKNIRGGELIRDNLYRERRIYENLLKPGEGGRKVKTYSCPFSNNMRNCEKVLLLCAKWSEHFLFQLCSFRKCSNHLAHHSTCVSRFFHLPFEHRDYPFTDSIELFTNRKCFSFSAKSFKKGEKSFSF